jgi:hypothetical protein
MLTREGCVPDPALLSKRDKRLVFERGGVSIPGVNVLVFLSKRSVLVEAASSSSALLCRGMR